MCGYAECSTLLIFVHCTICHTHANILSRLWLKFFQLSDTAASYSSVLVSLYVGSILSRTTGQLLILPWYCCYKWNWGWRYHRADRENLQKQFTVRYFINSECTLTVQCHAVSKLTIALKTALESTLVVQPGGYFSGLSNYTQLMVYTIDILVVDLHHKCVNSTSNRSIRLPHLRVCW